MGLSNDIFSRDIFYCLLQEIETLKTSILGEKEICESSKGINMSGHFIEQVIVHMPHLVRICITRCNLWAFRAYENTDNLGQILLEMEKT